NPLLDIRWATPDSGGYQAVHTQLTGAYNAENILAAISIALHFGVLPKQIERGISAYTPTNNRSQLTKTEHNTLICDYYNANASSMAAALENLRTLEAD